jgi:hypothetical protein
MCEPSEEYHIFCMIKSRPFEPGFIANTLLFEYNTPFDAEKNGSGKFDIHKQD